VIGMATTPELPEDNLARLREAINRAANPGLPALQQAFARMQEDHRAQLRAAVATPAVARFKEEMRRYLREVLAPAEQIRQDAIQQAMSQWSHDWRRAWEASRREQFTAAQALVRAASRLDTSPASRVLRDLEAWQALTAAQRDQAVAAVEEAYETTSPDDVPDEMVEEMQDAVRDFAASDDAFLPVEVRRQSFVLFIGTIVLASCLTLALTNDTVDALLGKAAGFSPIVGTAMIAAGLAWDRHTGNRRQEGNEN
jgi:hypothetical protein